MSEALDLLEDCYLIGEDNEIHYKIRKRLLRHLAELATYVENNQSIIPNYGERWRYKETITTSFIESAINEVVTKRMVKKQQMQWSRQGAHYLLQTRTAVLNGELGDYFKQWYPELKMNVDTGHAIKDLKKAA